MSGNPKADVQLEIGHVLFMDIVGYSKLLLDEQREFQEQLGQIVKNSSQVQLAEQAGKLIRIPTGDGMALVFFNSPEAPIRCALEISSALKTYPEMGLRMGIHSGPVNEVQDVNDRTNIAGAGVNIAQRVMDCGDAGHILLSKRAADDLAQSRQWQPYLHDLGQVETKHLVRIEISNLYNDTVGNPQLPEKILRANREQAAGAVDSRGPHTRHRRNVLIAGTGLLLALAIGSFWILPRVVVEKSIAVLPFENFSDDKENAFFADGIQDDILTSLAKIGNLKVISRSSVMQFRDVATRNLRDIGKTLGVGNVLEGSVRREGDRIVVNVQLIDARNDRHLWANRYTRTLADSLGLQGELAGEIAEALRVALSPSEKARVKQRPTQNSAAYIVYLKANQIERNPDTLLEDYKRAEQLYLQAITLDRDFALAHARLASTQAAIFHYYEPIDSWKTKAHAEANTALRLQSNLAEAHIALGQCAYWIDQDYGQALEQFDAALRFSPNNADVGGLVAAIKRRQGRWQEAVESYQRTAKIDPQNPNVIRNLVFTFTALRRWREASETAAKLRAMAPASLVAKIQSGYIDFWWKGETGLLKTLVSQVPINTDPDGTITSVRWEIAMIERDFTAARSALERSPLNEVAYLNGGPAPKSFLNGCVDLAQGNNIAAQKWFEIARPMFEKALEEAPDSADRHANLGWCYAFMGRKEEAIREGQKAVELKPESKDAFDGAIMSAYLALIYARVGEKDLALALIDRLLKTPGAVDSVDCSITVNDLKHRWEWDSIRDDPRFKQLLTEQAAAEPE